MRNFLLILSSLILFCCTQNVEVAKKSPKTSFSPDRQTDFLNKKYFNGYQMSADESTRSEHPFNSFLDCEKEGYFSVHFIPKKDSLASFWKNKYFEDNKYEYDDSETENSIIAKLLSGNNDQYNIFSYQIDKEYLQSNNGCTSESVFLKNKTVAKIYYYDQENKKWNFLKNIESQKLPPSVSSDFFKINFPKFFNTKIVENNKISQVEEKSVKLLPSDNKSYQNNTNKTDLFGTFKSKCANKNESFLLLLDSRYNKVREGTIEIYKQNKNLLAKMTVEYLVENQTIIYIGTSIIGDGIDIKTLTTFSKGNIIAKIDNIDENKISINWFGLYNEKTKKRMFEDNPFGKGRNAVLIKCN